MSIDLPFTHHNNPQVLLLGNGGRTVYLGPPEIAAVYFRTALGFSMAQNENPADVLMDVIGGKVARDNDPSFKPIHLVGPAQAC